MRRLACLALLAACLLPLAAQSARWSAARANAWYARQPWLVGADYINRGSINQLEMWQAATFDPQQIDQELGWAHAIGMNTMRVFLHDLLWKQDPAGFQQRINTFLAIAARHHIRPIFVLFDSCWDPNPQLGPQHPPIPGVHNSGWVQSPGLKALHDPAQYPRLEAYVKGVIGAFAHDPRVLAWDLWNEPDNGKDKNAQVALLLPQVYAWARSQNPTQPLTSGLFYGDWQPGAKLSPVQQIQIHDSDVLSFHNYSWPENWQKHVVELQAYHRPILCTEYMARSIGSTFDTILPLAFQDHVAAIDWGLVNGKTQTNLPWDSWQRPYVEQQPPIWFHDVFYPSGKPYRQHEANLILRLTTQANGAPQP